MAARTSSRRSAAAAAGWECQVELDTGRGLDVEAYRTLLGQRHRAEAVVDEASAERAELVFNLSRLHSRLSQDFEARHRRLGWSWAGFRIMNVLWAVGAVELRELARLAGVSRAAISSALNALQRDGLVSRARERADRRLVRIELTEQGRARLREGMLDQAERERRWFAALDPEELRALTRTLAALADQVRPVEDETAEK